LDAPPRLYSTARSLHDTLETRRSPSTPLAFDPHNPDSCRRITQHGQLTQLDGTSPTVTYTAQNLPDGAAFDPVTAMFCWLPTYDQAGQYTVHFTATANDPGLPAKHISSTW
jgi:hypothetical protein